MAEYLSYEASAKIEDIIDDELKRIKMGEFVAEMADYYEGMEEVLSRLDAGFSDKKDVTRVVLYLFEVLVNQGRIKVSYDFVDTEHDLEVLFSAESIRLGIKDNPAPSIWISPKD